MVEASSAAGPGRTLRAQRSLRIVVVDDERDMVTTLAALLTDEGHAVQGLYRAQDVMSTVKEFDPDVVMLDIALPDGSGYALAEQIRRRYGGTRPLLIALTGVYSRPPHDKLYRIVGCDHFLTKPFALEEVLRLIEPLTN
jgi:DNA-binding response OmpR family regulator